MTETTTFQFALGASVRDKVTGYTGIVAGRAEYRNLCLRYSVQGPVQDGKIADSLWADENDLELIGSGLSNVKLHRELVRTGGPYPAPQRAPDPPR